MKVLLLGATGMVGQAVLRECLRAADVSELVVVGRTGVQQVHPKIRQLVVADLMSLDTFAAELTGFDACFYCVGVSSSGISEAAYRQITYEVTLRVARSLAAMNPGMTFVYVSGAGADSSEQGRSMWARVRGKTENELKKLPFRSVYLFRPAIIQPLHGIQSKTAAYRNFYRIAKPLLSLLRRMWPGLIVTTDDVGQAMLNAVRQSEGRAVLESRDIIRLARR